MLKTLSQALLRSHRHHHTAFPKTPAFFFLSSPFSRSSRTDAESKDDVFSLINRDPTSPPRLFVVQPRLRPDTFLQAKLNEALCLANSLEEQRDGFFLTDFFNKELPPNVVVQNPAIRSPKPRADTFFGPGTVDTITCHLLAAEQKSDVDAVFVNTILTGIQQRNLERIWGKPVLDRVGLIVEIFNAHAYTKEAKLQAELAALMYKKTRLVRVRGPDGRYAFGISGEAEVVSAKGRGSGGRGFMSGAGETELQLQRRRILERRSHLLSQIEDVRRTRALQRAARKRHGGSHGKGLATVAVVGYTNAGKSTLVSALSDSDLYSDARLFATVDPRLRSVILPSGRKVLVSDTVGFISDLPVQLVDAFHATLEEVVEADLLVHVLDSSAPNLDEHQSSVLQVLEQIGVPEEKVKNMIEVWNKIDLEEDQMLPDEYDFDAEDGEVNDFPSGDEDAASETLECIEGDEANLWGSEEPDMVSDRPAGKYRCDDYSDPHEDGNIVSELSVEELEEVKDSELVDSDNWHLQPEDICLDNKQSQSVEENGLDQKQCNSSVWTKPGVADSQAQFGPHVKISAVTGVGLQQLLELIDEKLKIRDESLMAKNVVERSSFDRKWRPPRTDDAIAVEQ